MKIKLPKNAAAIAIRLGYLALANPKKALVAALVVIAAIAFGVEIQTEDVPGVDTAPAAGGSGIE